MRKEEGVCEMLEPGSCGLTSSEASSIEDDQQLVHEHLTLHICHLEKITLFINWVG